MEQNLDEISLKWEEGVGVEEYQVFYQEQFANTSNRLTTTTNSITIKPLILLKNYEIKVLSKNKAGKSAAVSLNFTFTGTYTIKKCFLIKLSNLRSSQLVQ